MEWQHVRPGTVGMCPACDGDKRVTCLVCGGYGRVRVILYPVPPGPVEACDGKCRRCVWSAANAWGTPSGCSCPPPCAGTGCVTCDNAGCYWKDTAIARGEKQKEQDEIGRREAYDKAEVETQLVRLGR